MNGSLRHRLPPNETGVGEELLAGPGAGGGTIRIGDTVRREPRRAPEGMLRVLEHLEHVGFQGSPRLLGRDERGRWVLTYIPGDVALTPYETWCGSNKLLVSVARLLRSYHEAMRSFECKSDIYWPTKPPRGYEGRTIGHMDVSMANVVCVKGIAAALIDFEEVGAVAAVWDVARTARHWVPLLDPYDLVDYPANVFSRQHERLRLFADAYDLSAADRSRFLDAALLNADVTYERMRRGAEMGHVGYENEWSGNAAKRNRRAKAWMEKNREKLHGILND
jgi:hypothetical protein